MRNSTNIFLVNLSVADLCVLLICTPTVLVEVNSGPQVWPLGEHMCKAVPFVELTVAHASVLTILAISFERYYAICEPLRAGYVCTKARATFLCLLAWVAAALCTSPILLMVSYEVEKNTDGTYISTCNIVANSDWASGFIVTTILVFFVIPLLILVILYTVIARHLMTNPTISRGSSNNLLKYRKQVMLMLGTVVLCFFLCLLPFRAFTLWILVVPPKMITDLGIEGYFTLLYFCRVMLYLNSAINPILYNLMSTKFREGFLRLCGLAPTRRKKKKTSGDKTGTYTTGSTNCSSNHSDFWRRHSSNKSSSVKVPSSNSSGEKQIKLPLQTAVVSGNIVRKKQESYV
ncbi:ecdysis triggering hormone receptor isoform X6 [Osmia lignaria lignaria]|nr:growth hormone secretagogue receptor type 1 isoform X6 [Osmia lignaria]